MGVAAAAPVSSSANAENAYIANSIVAESARSIEGLLATSFSSIGSANLSLSKEFSLELGSINPPYLLQLFYKTIITKRRKFLLKLKDNYNKNYITTKLVLVLQMLVFILFYCIKIDSSIMIFDSVVNLNNNNFFIWCLSTDSQQIMFIS